MELLKERRHMVAFSSRKHSVVVYFLFISLYQAQAAQYNMNTKYTQRQTDDRRHIMTTAGHCNAIATFSYKTYKK